LSFVPVAQAAFIKAGVARLVSGKAGFNTPIATEIRFGPYTSSVKRKIPVILFLLARNCDAGRSDDPDGPGRIPRRRPRLKKRTKS